MEIRVADLMSIECPQPLRSKLYQELKEGKKVVAKKPNYATFCKKEVVNLLDIATEQKFNLNVSDRLWILSTATHDQLSAIRAIWVSILKGDAVVFGLSKEYFWDAYEVEYPQVFAWELACRLAYTATIKQFGKWSEDLRFGYNALYDAIRAKQLLEFSDLLK